MRVALLLILLLAFALRVGGLDAQELRGDEAFGYFFSLRPPAEIVDQTLDLREPHPVASYFVQHAWLAVAGHSEFALRFVSAWFGLLAVAWMARLAHDLQIGVPGTLVATLLLAISPYAVWHSQDARMYSMSLALTLASMGFVVAGGGWRVAGGRWRVASGYVLVSWLALHTHYFAAFVIVAQNLFVVGWLLWGRSASGWHTFWQWAGIQVVLALLYLPWILRARFILTGYTGNGDSPGALEALWRVLVAFTTGGELPSAGVLFGLLAVVLFLFGAWQLWRREQRSLLLLLFYLLVPLLATWISALRRPIFDERYLIAAVPPFYLLLAAALPARIPRPFPALLPLKQTGVALFLCGWLVGGMALGLVGYYTDPVHSKTVGWRDLAATFHKFSADLPPNAVRLVENFPDPTLWYYYNTVQGGEIAHLVLPPAPHDVAGVSDVVDELVAQGVQRAVLAVQPAPNWDDSGIAAAALGARYLPLLETTAGAWPVQLYARPPAELTPLDVHFQNGLVLTGAAFAPESLVPGGALTVHLAWDRTGAILSGGEKVFVHLTGPDGVPVAQADRALDDAETQLRSEDGDSFVTNYGILLPDLLTGQAYEIRAGLYDGAQADAPRIVTQDDRDFLLLGELPVASP